jgi:hypothetical protein
MLPVAMALSAACYAESAPVVSSTIDVDTTVVYQTMRGWSAVAQVGQELAGYERTRDTALALVTDLGINRVRIEAWSGMESDRDYWRELGQVVPTTPQWRCVRFATVNDNDDPFTIDWRGFHFGKLDQSIEQVVLPLRQRLAARGETLWVNLTYVGFNQNLCPGRGYHHPNDPEEYAEMALATFLHLREKYGLVPDSWEALLEPYPHIFGGEQLARSLIATRRRLAAHGFAPLFVAPSMSRAPETLPYVDAMSRVPEVWSNVVELSFHRYGGVSREQLTAISNRARSLGVETAQMELIGADYEMLHDDLRYGNVSTWQQFTIAYAGGDNGGHHVTLDLRDPDHSRADLGRRSRFLRQYFHYVRRGARRVEARSDDSSLDAVAFINRDGRRVVVVKSDGPNSFAVRGLPAGEYGVSRTTDDGTDSTIVSLLAAAGALPVRLPRKGVLTIYAR